MARRRLPTVLVHGFLAVLPLLLASALASAPASASPAPARPAASRKALREGNRLYRQGNLEGALAAYRSGAAQSGPGAVDPLLAYNLATTLHHLGRLPGAVLWYRRAAAGLGDDPWLRENLARARAQLGARRLGPPPLLGPTLRHPWLTGTLAAVCAWAGLLLALSGAPARSRGRPARRLAGGLLAAALVFWIGGLALSRFGPRPAVLLDACGELPAGSEVWVTPEAGGRFRVIRSGEDCEAAAVGVVRPRRTGLGLLVM